MNMAERVKAVTLTLTYTVENVDPWEDREVVVKWDMDPATLNIQNTRFMRDIVDPRKGEHWSEEDPLRDREILTITGAIKTPDKADGQT